jgi:hypothetical protein
MEHISDEDLAEMDVHLPPPIDATKVPGALLLRDAKLLLTHPFLPMESGAALNSEGMYHIAASTYMPKVTGAMIEWWFGYVTTTDQFKMWHPLDHEYSERHGPRGNSTYIGGYHLVRRRIGDDMHHLRVAFKDPSEYLGAEWRYECEINGYATAICARTGIWSGPGIEGTDYGHLIYLVKRELDGVRIRFRCWLGDVPGVEIPDIRARLTSPKVVEGILKHSLEEMAILATFLPSLYDRENSRSTTGTSDWLRTVVDDRAGGS